MFIKSDLVLFLNLIDNTSVPVATGKKNMNFHSKVTPALQELCNLSYTLGNDWRHIRKNCSAGLSRMSTMVLQFIVHTSQ